MANSFKRDQLSLLKRETASPNGPNVQPSSQEGNASQLAENSQTDQGSASEVNGAQHQQSYHDEELGGQPSSSSFLRADPVLGGGNERARLSSKSESHEEIMEEYVSFIYINCIYP